MRVARVEDVPCGELVIGLAESENMHWSLIFEWFEKASV